MQSSEQRPRIISLKSKFVQSREKLRSTTDETPIPVSRQHRSQNPPALHRRESNGVSKARKPNAEKIQTPRSILVDNFSASLDEYRENLHNEATKDIATIENDLTTTLDRLALDAQNHFKQLINIEDPLQRTFSEELLRTQTHANVNDDQNVEEIALKDRMDAFRKLRLEKGKVLRQLWDDWEDLQMQLISLTAEVCGSDAIILAPEQEEDMKEEQREELNKTLDQAEAQHAEANSQINGLHQELRVLQEAMKGITSMTKQTVVDMQQQYNDQKNKLFKGLHRHIELLASL